MRYAEFDVLVLRLARAQDGVVARWQLVAGGMPTRLLDDRVKRRRLERISRGLYRIPHLRGPRADVFGAVLGAGPDAVASHESAGHLQELITDRPRHLAVSVSAGNPAPRPGIVLHRVRLPSDERTTCDGVPVTSHARTILDLASLLPNRGLEQALARGLRRRDGLHGELRTLLDRYPRRPGTPRLRAMLGSDRAPTMTRSEAEERFLALIRTAQLPAPQVNVRVHGFEADFLWWAHKVVVEIDGLAYHSTPDAQARDRQRDTALGAAGIRVLRFTWQDLTALPEATLVKVALALGRAAV